MRFENPIDLIREKVRKTVQESRLPNKDYESTVGVYGGKLRKDEDGKMIFDMSGVVSRVDQTGDAVLRSLDEHTIKDPLKLFKRHPRLFLRFAFTPGTKRYRGSPDEIADQVDRLGLSEFYGKAENGIEVKHPELYEKGRVLQDIFRADIIGDEGLLEIDRFKALEKAAQYVSLLHQDKSAIGEVLPSDIIFLDHEGKSVINPLLNIPDIIYNPEKKTSEIDKKTTDLLDFVMSMGVEEYRRSEGDWESVKKAMQVILSQYQDKKVVALVGSFASRGRLTMIADDEKLGLSKTAKLMRPLAAQHNKARLAFDPTTIQTFRDLIIEVCEEASVRKS